MTNHPAFPARTTHPLAVHAFLNRLSECFKYSEATRTQALPGADPGFRRGGGTFRRGGGGVVHRNFRSGSKLLQGPGQINKQTKIADSRRGGSDPPPPKKKKKKKNLYPRLPTAVAKPLSMALCRTLQAELIVTTLT